MNIIDIVFHRIRTQNGKVDVQALSKEVLSKHPTSKWDISHWNFYRSQITSPKGRYAHLFSDEIKNNLRETMSSPYFVRDSSFRAKPSTATYTGTPEHHSFKFTDRTREVEKDMAVILAKVSHHIHPTIVEKIVIDNRKLRVELERAIIGKYNLDDYLFEGSDCLFPGTRRPTIKEKVGNWKNNICGVDGCILDDNMYPRHLWTFLCCNKMYSSPSWIESGLNSFELAHIFSHKVEERAFDLSCFRVTNTQVKPYYLFTSASNVVLIPKGLTKPTDKLDTVKLVFFKRHFELYGNMTQLPSLRGFREEFVPAWYNELEWNEPILPTDWETRINNLLRYRKNMLLSKYSSMPTYLPANNS